MNELQADFAAWSGVEKSFAVDRRRGKLASNPRMLSMAPGRQGVSTAPRSHGNAAMIPPGCTQHDHRNPAILPSGITRAAGDRFRERLDLSCGFRSVFGRNCVHGLGAERSLKQSAPSLVTPQYNCGYRFPEKCHRPLFRQLSGDYFEWLMFRLLWDVRVARDSKISPFSRKPCPIRREKI